MTTITYYGLHSDCYELLTNERFHSLIKNNPDLELVEVSYDSEDGKKTFTPVFISINSEPKHNIALIDHANDDQLMWVIYDDLASVENPSQLLVKALTIMDEFVLETRETRLFETNTGHYLDDNCILKAGYDFEYGDYDI
jgi:hypothetical protein